MGAADIFSHVLEQYLHRTKAVDVSDNMSLGILEAVHKWAPVAVEQPDNLDARSNLMWTAAMALNTLTKMGKSQDWMVHMIGQSIGAYTDATHGMTLAAVSLPYYRYLLPYGVAKFARFAKNVWGVVDGDTEMDTAMDGLLAMENWMKELGLVLHSAELGVTEDMLDGIAAGSFILTGGYKTLSHEEIVTILYQSL